ncbi:hypothetical protein [Eubacterium ventriosum]
MTITVVSKKSNYKKVSSTGRKRLSVLWKKWKKTLRCMELDKSVKIKM